MVYVYCHEILAQLWELLVACCSCKEQRIYVIGRICLWENMHKLLECKSFIDSLRIQGTSISVYSGFSA